MLGNDYDYKVNKKTFTDDIKMIHEFIEFVGNSEYLLGPQLNVTLTPQGC